MLNRQPMPLTTNTVESSNIRQQKNSSSNTFLHSLTVALNLTIQVLEKEYSNIQYAFPCLKIIVAIWKMYFSNCFNCRDLDLVTIYPELLNLQSIHKLNMINILNQNKIFRNDCCIFLITFDKAHNISLQVIINRKILQLHRHFSMFTKRF